MDAHHPIFMGEDQMNMDEVLNLFFDVADYVDVGQPPVVNDIVELEDSSSEDESETSSDGYTSTFSDSEDSVQEDAVIVQEEQRRNVHEDAVVVQEEQNLRIEFGEWDGQDPAGLQRWGYEVLHGEPPGAVQSSFVSSTTFDPDDIQTYQLQVNTAERTRIDPATLQLQSDEVSSYSPVWL